MRDPLSIGPADARVMVTGPELSPGLRTLLDHTEAAPTHAPTSDESVIAMLDEVPEPHEITSSLAGHAPRPSILVTAAARACRWRAAGRTGPVVVEVALTEGIGQTVADLRRSGEVVGVVVSSPGPESSQALDHAAAHGRTIGLLTAAVLAGVATIRTDDPATARRVRAVAFALTGPDGDDARMNG